MFNLSSKTIANLKKINTGKKPGLNIKYSKNWFETEGSVKKLEKIKIIRISNKTVPFAKIADKKILIFLLFTCVSFET